METNNPYRTPQTTAQPESSSSKLSAKEVLFSFKGRIPRSTFWGYSLLSGLAFYALVLPCMFIFGQDSGITITVMALAYIPLVWASLAIQSKRWHDRDKSGLWIFIGLIPLIGAVWSFVETGCLKGTDGPNNYCNDPL
ncbi:MAG: DUF805 domain-containing protein [Rubritalea sp.]|uniref:DUF805 domain-containing protein n=1 Tax=Rubritalea sp. TaxID=2109375 RepID=UPI00324233E7